MSKIINEPKSKFPLHAKLRELLEHRALWLYFLVEESESRGLKAEEFAASAMRNCGLYRGEEIIKQSGTTSLKGLRKVLFTRSTQTVFDMELIEETDDCLSINCYYCPLVKAWQKQDASDDTIRRLCEIASCDYFGVGETLGVELEIPKVIARGDDYCALRFVRPSKESPMECYDA